MSVEQRPIRHGKKGSDYGSLLRSTMQGVAPRNRHCQAGMRESSQASTGARPSRPDSCKWQVKSRMRIDTLKKLIIAHRDNEDAAFVGAVESIVNELLVENRPGEAKMIRSLLGDKSKPSMPIEAANLHVLPANRRSGEVLIATPKREVHREQVFLNKETADDIDRVILEYRSRLELARHGLPPASKLLFWGPPGCGKTITAQMIASELDIGFGVVRLSSLITSFVGETAANLHRVLSVAATSPMVLLLDEADAVAKNREDRNDVGELKRVVNSLLQAMDEFSSDKSILILASNHQHLIDSAIWRRFDEVIEFTLPDPPQRRDFIHYLTSGVKISGSIAELIKRLGGMSFADIQRCITNAQKEAVLNRKDHSITTIMILEQADKLKHKRAAAQASRSQQ